MGIAEAGRTPHREPGIAQALLALAGAGLSACASHDSAVADALQPRRSVALQRALLGAWCAREAAGQPGWALDMFTPDGRLLACGRRPDDAVPFQGAGPVTAQADRLCCRVEQASESFWVQPGSQYIVGISASRQFYEDLDTGQRHELIRVPPSQAAQALEQGCPGLR